MRLIEAARWYQWAWKEVAERAKKLHDSARAQGKEPSAEFLTLQSYLFAYVPSSEIIETIAQEEAHFKATFKKNLRKKLQMQRRRNLIAMGANVDLDAIMAEEQDDSEHTEGDLAIASMDLEKGAD